MGQDEIILLGTAIIVTRCRVRGGLISLSHHILGYFWQYLMAVFDGV